MKESAPGSARREGAALIITLWVLMILALMMSAFAFDMHIEAGITSYYRKRMKAQYLARAGVEYAKLLLVKSFEGNETPEGEEARETERIRAINLSRSVALTGLSQELGAGKFTLNIAPEPGRRNVNHLDDADWEEILDQGGVPNEMWPELIDCFNDWVDESDEHRLNGAESDDAFYEEQGYEVKNAPLDTVDELLLIKGFTPALVYGGADPEREDVTYTGIAQLLTTWGEGKVNVNNASREVLLTLGTDQSPVPDFVIEDIIAGRAGQDEMENTKDDGWESVDEVISETGLDDSLRDKITTSDRRYVRVESIGEVQGVRNGIWCILSVDSGNVTPVFWREENMR